MTSVWIRRTLFVCAIVCASSGSWAAEQPASQSQGSKAGNSASVLARVRPLAKQGDPKAQYNMGVIYDRGYGVERDYAKARGWYEKAAAQGDAEAAHNLGVMYHEGHGVPVDNKRAVYWFRKAAKRGEPAAQNNLAVMYAEGMGVERDLAQAVKWMARAAAAGNESAVENLPVLAAELPQATVDGDNVNVRARPTTDADVLAQADVGAEVAVLQQSDEWSRVLVLPDYVVGWVANSLLMGPQPNAVVPEQEITAAGGQDAAVSEQDAVAGLEQGSTTMAAGDESARIDSTGVAAATQAPPTAAGDVFVANPPDATVADGQAPVTEHASATGAVGDTRDAATAAAGDGESKASGESGAEQATTKTVGVDTANVRKKPSRQDTVLFRLHRGDVVTVIKSHNGWAYVETDAGSQGWIADYLLVGG